ncbi:acyltransferase family protein [Pseudomonas lini]
MSVLKKLSHISLEKPVDRYNNFLYVRLMASTMVVAGHSLGLSREYSKESMAYFSILGFPIHGIGVLVFFLLSGYLVSTSLFNSASIKEFFLSRAVRILPGLTVCVAWVVFFLGPLLSEFSIVAYFSDPDTWRYLINNMMLINAEFSLPGVGHVVNGSLWTIPIEARLYLL